MFDTGLSQSQITGQVQQKLIALRAALDDCQALQQWSAGVPATDLEAIGYNAADASALQSAIADAAAVAAIYTTGLPPSAYPQPPTAYVYGASQRQVIGPQ